MPYSCISFFNVITTDFIHIALINIAKVDINRKMTKENRASGTDHSEKVISITFSGNKKESIRDGHPLPYASASHTLLLFDFPYYTRLGTNTIKDSHFYTRYGIKVGARQESIPIWVYCYSFYLIASMTFLIFSLKPTFSYLLHFFSTPS